MNLIAREIFNWKQTFLTVENTFIGGVSSAIYTPQLLANKILIDVSRITAFSIVGSDIKCKITGSYVLPSSCWNVNFLITYYHDGGLITDLGNECFREAKNINEVYFEGIINLTGYQVFAVSYKHGVKRVSLPNCVSISYQAFYSEYNPISMVYIPKCTNLGADAGYNQVFRGSILSNIVIYAHPSLQTKNAGAMDGDLSFRNITGSSIRFVANDTIPNSINNLSSGTIYSTAVQLNFSVPISTNGIDFYECYANDVLMNTIKASGEYIVGLLALTNYELSVFAVDMFKNKSLISNKISVTTNNQSAVPLNNLRSYYKLNETSGVIANDSFGTEHLTNTGVSIGQSGKFGNCYKATAHGQKLETNSATPITGNWSINYWTYLTANAATYSSPMEFGVWTATGFGIWMEGGGSPTIRYGASYSINTGGMNSFTANEWVMVTATYDGANIKSYINGVLVKTYPYTTNPIGSTLKTMFSRSNNTVTSYLGSISNACHYIGALTQNEIDRHYSKGNGITL